MADHSAEFRRCMEELDIQAARRLWKHVSPHLAQPTSDTSMLACLHLARTQSESIRSELRAYSHRWLLDNGYPSQLPDRLKPYAERLYPVIADAVGISVNSNNKLMKPIIPQVRGAMENVVLDCYADGQKDPSIIKARMNEAKQSTVRKLVGINL